MKEFLLYSEVNIICIAVLVIIAFNIKHSEYSPGRRPRTLLKLIACTCGFYVLDVFRGVVRLDFPDPAPFVIYICSAIYFLFFAAAAYMWFYYSEILHNKAFFDNRRAHLLLAIPLLILVVLFVVSYFNGMIFTVDADGNYSRGAFFFLQPLLSFIYIAAAGVRTAYCAYKNTRSSNHRDLVTFSNYSFIALVCGTMQFIFGEFPIMIIGTTVSTLLLYLHYLRNMISLDPLTNVNNRRKLLYETNEMTRILKLNEELYFMFVDVDSFKLINDKYGHMEGDRILQEVSHIIRKFCKKYGCLCGRYGGDEFAIVQVVKHGQDFKSPELLYKMLEEKNIKIRDTEQLTVSIGYAKHEPHGSISDLVQRADKNMYEVKRAKKRKQTAKNK